jgi:perosamine synthetase
LEAFDSGWISSQGSFLTRFEKDFAAFAGTRFALATSSGTTALHIALLSLGVQPGDEVIVPTFTYVATANAVQYCGAIPVLVDCERDTWNLDPGKLAAAITPRTVGIIPVHLYGHPCEMELISAIARQHRLWVIEDAAEAHGAWYQGRRVGTFGAAAAFSLFGNKIITTGEGGVVTTNDEQLAEKLHMLRGQGMDPERRYWFPIVGFNYRMTNTAAALGVSQLMKIDKLIAAHRRVAGWYREEFEGTPDVALPVERDGVFSVFWLYSIRMISAECRPELRDALMESLKADGIDTRPFFYPMHVMPVYRQDGDFEVSERVASSGLNLPSSPLLEREDVAYIAARVKHHLARLSDLQTAGSLPGSADGMLKGEA